MPDAFDAFPDAIKMTPSAPAAAPDTFASFPDAPPAGGTLGISKPPAIPAVVAPTGVAAPAAPAAALPQPSFTDIATQSLLRGAMEGGGQVKNAMTPFVDRPAAPAPTDAVGKLLAEPLHAGWSDPKWLAAQMLHGVGESAPSLAMGAAGTVGGGLTFGPVGAVAGGAGGYGAGAALQTIAGAYQRARADGLDHDAAVDRAWKETGLAGGAGVASGVLPEVKLFGKTFQAAGPAVDGLVDMVKSAKKPISEALAQIFGVQPAVGAATQAGNAQIENKPLTAEQLAQGYIQNVGTGAALTGIGAAKRTVFPTVETVPEQPSAPASKQGPIVDVTPPSAPAAVAPPARLLTPPVQEPRPAPPVEEPPAAPPQAPAAIAVPPVETPQVPAMPPEVQTAETKPTPASAPAQVTPPAPISSQVTPADKNVSKVVTPDNSMEISARNEVVPAASLVKAGADLQPRDRTRDTSDMQIRNIAANLDPARLGDSRTTDQGSPIVGPDHVVESGNGRVAAIRQAYAEHPEAAARYKEFLQQQGHNIEGIKDPVLVRRRISDLTPEDRVKFTSLSNKSSIAEMSSTEKARADAKSISDEMLSMHQGGEPDKAENQDFVHQYLQKAVTKNEQGALIDGENRLSQEGVKRVKAALVAKAYDNPDLVSNIFESADPEVKSLGNVLRDRAPEVAQLSAAVRAGEVPARFDIAGPMMKAVDLIRSARKDNKPVREVIEGTKQIGMGFGERKVDPLVEKIVRSLHRPELGKMLSQKAMDRVLEDYTTKAKEQRAADLFGENKTTPEQLLEQAYKEVTKEPEAPANQPTMLDALPEEDTLKNSRVTRRPYDLSTDPEELAKTAGKTFTEFSTKRDLSDVHKQVFTMAGMDPEKAARLPPERQLKIVSDFAKNSLGLDIKVHAGADVRYAIDQAANATAALHDSASVLGLDPKFMGLDGKLALTIRKNYSALGSFDPNINEITLPQRSNSMMHEWFHALDFNLVKKYGGADSMFSREIRKEGISTPADATQHAYVDLLNSVFFDKAQLATKLKEMEDQVASGTPKQKEAAQAVIDQIKAGTYKGISAKSDYFKSVKEFSDAAYWTNPAEMLARAFEAHVANRLDDMGLTSDKGTKGNLAYLSNADDRLAKTFPKVPDRLAIYDAFNKFFGTMGQEKIMDRLPPEASTDMGILDPSRLDKITAGIPDIPKNLMSYIKELLQNEKDNILGNFDHLREHAERVERQKAAGIDQGNSLWESTWRAYENFERPLAEKAQRLEKLYPSASLNQINNRYFMRPGSGESIKATYSSRYEGLSRQWKAQLTNLISAHDYTSWSEKERGDLTKLMKGRDVAGADPKVEKLASTMRAQVFDKYWNEMNVASKDKDAIGYYKDSAYLTRKPMAGLVAEDPEGAIEDYTKAYAEVFDHKYKGEITDENIGDFMSELKNLAGSSASEFSGKDFKALVQKIGDDPEAAKKELQEHYDEAKENFAQEAAQNYVRRIIQGGDGFSSREHNGLGRPSFAKERVFPPAADVHLDKWTEPDVFKVASDYANRAARRVAEIESEKPKDGPTIGELFKQAQKEGVPGRELKYLQNLVDQAKGNGNLNEIDRTTGKFWGLIHEASVYKALGRAAFSHLRQTLQTPVVTGDAMDSFRVMVSTLKTIAKTNDMKEWKKVADMHGLLSHGMNKWDYDSMYGSGVEVGRGQRERINKFFEQTQLEPLINFSRQVLMPVLHQKLLRLSDDVLSDGRGQRKGESMNDLADFTGLDRDKIPGFAKWMKNEAGHGNPSADSPLWNTPYGRALQEAHVRLNQHIIPAPNATELPVKATQSPISSLFYTGLRFHYSAFRSQNKREFTKIVKTFEQYGLKAGLGRAAKGIAIQMATQVPAAALQTMLKMYIFDHDQWNNLQDHQEKLYSLIMLQTLENMNLFGGIGSRIIGAATGLSYGKDLATSLSGASYSQPLDLATRLMTYGDMPAKFGAQSTNSKTTNSAERAAARAVYSDVAAPLLISQIVRFAPGGGLVGGLAGLAESFIGSGTTGNAVANTIVGPSNSGRGGSPDKEPKETREPRDPRG